MNTQPNRQKKATAILLAIIVLAVIACGGLTGASRKDNEAPEVEIPQVEIPNVEIPDVEIPDVEIPNVEIPQPGTPAGNSAADSSPTATPRPTSSPTPTPQPVTLSGQGAWFRIEKSAHSSQGALEDVVLNLRSAKLTATGLLLHLAFENETNRQFWISGHFDNHDFRLVDSSGNGYDALEVDENLTGIDPDNTFAPGGANVGNVVFPIPEGKPPYKLRLTSYDPVEFQLNTPLDEQPPLDVPAGVYPIGVDLYASDGTLNNISLRVESLQATDDSLTFNLAFVNTSRRGFDLLMGPQGDDAWLLDGERRQYAPIAVSDSIAASIAPEKGWLPGEAYAGSITFPRPADMRELRFLFTFYSPLTLRFNDQGLAQAQITSVWGGAPPPTPTPHPGKVAYQNINALLAQQAAAINAGDQNAYLASFAPDLREEQRVIFERMTRARLSDYALELDPGESFSDYDLEDGELWHVNVLGQYALEGIPADNPFVYAAEYTFNKMNGQWQITEIDNDETPPFWVLGDFALHETEHFLIFARPESEGELPLLAKEVEDAYATLLQKGLTLEPRYAAYFTAPDEDLYDLTGQIGSRLLGLALSRYEFDAKGIHTNSRAFYINGKAFARYAEDLSPDERPATILHELVHLALSKETMPFTPPWVSEGAAVYYAGQASPEELRRLVDEGRLNDVFLTDLTGARSLGEHDFWGERVGFEYLYSGAAASYLIETYGAETFLDFYGAYAEVPTEDVADKVSGFFITSFGINASMVELAEEKTGELAQQFFGRTLEELDADVKAWLVAQ